MMNKFVPFLHWMSNLEELLLNISVHRYTFLDGNHLIKWRQSKFANHDDYIEQFLDDTKVCLSNYITLFVEYCSLRRVTHIFTRARTQINCAKVKYLVRIDTLNVPKAVSSIFSSCRKTTIFLQLVK